MVTVINETFAKRFFDGRNPIGLHVTQTYANKKKTYQVVGVVQDSRQNRLRGEIEHRFYVPATQPAAEINAVTFAIRPAPNASGVMAAVRRVVNEAEPAMVITSARTVTESVDRRLVQDRLLAQLSIAFGAVALLLAALGLYGVLSYGVARRTNEIGIRKALGAQHGTVMAMILRETGWLLVLGLVAGSALAAAALRLITSRLYGLETTDPVAFASAIVLLSIVAGLATWLPARRASRVDPLVALRYE
jgi:ABC-type antimicrobial peptide transport system permease subunit